MNPYKCIVEVVVWAASERHAMNELDRRDLCPKRRRPSIDAELSRNGRIPFRFTLAA